MKSLRRVLGISLLASFALIGVNSANAITDCSNIESAEIRACVANHLGSACFSEAEEEYQQCMAKGPIPPPRTVALEQNVLETAQPRSILLYLSSPRIALDLRLQ